MNEKHSLFVNHYARNDQELIPWKDYHQTLKFSLFHASFPERMGSFSAIFRIILKRA